MNAAIVISGALVAGVVVGFVLASMRGVGDPSDREGKERKPTPPSPLFNQRGGAEYPTGHKGGGVDSDLVMVDYFPMSKKALKGWEKEQAKKERRRA